jgi:hypothetical protein
MAHLDGGEGEHDVGLSLNVGVEHTENVLEIRRAHQRHLLCNIFRTLLKDGTNQSEMADT